MITISVIILTKNRSKLLRQALLSVETQTYKDCEVIVVNDGSTDGTPQVVEEFRSRLPLQIINHHESQGITASRNEALQKAAGEYVAFLDDDDEWADKEKLSKQVAYFRNHPGAALVGGGISLQIPNSKFQIPKFRPEADASIRKWMLLKNPFFTSTVMVKRLAALAAGGFVKDEDDLAEDYDLWLRMGTYGEMYNFQEVFTLYRQPGYNKEKFKQFLRKQQRLISRYKLFYPHYLLSSIIIWIRLFIKLF